MDIGVPKELKKQEYRVSITPAGVAELVNCKHNVWVEAKAGEGAGYTDIDYKKAGAHIVSDARKIWEVAELIVKVKEPLPQEYQLARAGQYIFTYFHFASSRELTEAMVRSGATCIAYETVQKEDLSLPLLMPMSEIAGRMAVQQGAHFLEKHKKGRGILLGGIPGVHPAHVLILGAGTVGSHAAKIAAGMGAKVTIMDINLARLRALHEIMPANVCPIFSSEYNITEALKTADLVIGAVLVPGAKAPILIKKEMLKLMRPGSVIIDVAVDQGGCIETCYPTSHEHPTYTVSGVIHYCVPNMPGAVPYTATLGLTNATLPYIKGIANRGLMAACKEYPELAKGVNIIDGVVAHRALAELFSLPYKPFMVSP
ncbi:MAG: alanine dehydrogenase [Cytophagaceae bacterium]|nr:alanine dehydrogenase [Cytophagaceae bacterium]MDW8456265.1 alanine dehydrogenase [Cytophagaceae bacterium]